MNDCKYSIIRDREFYQSKLVREGKSNLFASKEKGRGQMRQVDRRIFWTAKTIGDSSPVHVILSQTIWWEETEGSKCWEAVYFPDDRPRKWKVAEQLRWWKWKEALGAIAHYQPNSTYNNIKQIPRIFSVVFSNQYRTDPASSSYHAFTVTISTTVKSRLVSFNDSAVHPKSSDQH